MTDLDDLLLPPRARLLHIGPPKTGSTALQTAAAAHRAELLAHGVRYPGRRKSQRPAIAAFLGRQIGFVSGESAGTAVPDRTEWDALMAEIEADGERRIWLGHEYAAGSDDATAARMVEALGPRAHVVITLRDYGSMLPSIWQEYNKAGNTGLFDDWLRRVLAVPRPAEIVDSFHRRHDQGQLIRRWAQAAGRENVTVVVADPSNHVHMFDAFSDMLGLPRELLRSAAASASHDNRSLSVPELEMLRRLNEVTRAHGVEWPDYQRYVVRGAARRMLRERRPGTTEQRLLIPAWARERVAEEAVRHAEEIAASSVRIVGDVSLLARAPRVRRDDEPEHQDVELVSVDAAVEALAGLLSMTLTGTRDFRPKRGARAARSKPNV